MQKPSFSRIAYGALALATAAFAPAIAAPPARPAPIVIDKLGSFTIGGRVLGSGDKTLHCDHGYVDYTIPANRRKIGIFFWHSSSAEVWQQRWDGGEGFQQMALRRGYPTYIWDGPRVGRGNWSCEDIQYKAEPGRDQGNVVAWRLGPKAGEWFPGVQFPKDNAAAFDQAMSARYDEFDIPKNAHLEGEAGAKAIDKLGPSIVATNSAGDWRAMLAAMASNTTNVRAIVAFEPAAFVFPDGEGPQEPEGGFGPTHVPLDQFKKLTRFPILIVWGDNTEKMDFWRKTVPVADQFVASINKHGGHAEILRLPSVGLHGNTHIPFSDMNNDKVFAQFEAFLHRNKLDER